MKIYLDDERVAPQGWVQTRWPAETIALLQQHPVTHLSLDHDLGDDECGTGYDVLLWMEQAVVVDGYVPPESITIHSANASAWRKMSYAIDSIRRFAGGATP
jgi:hypothetical protein